MSEQTAVQKTESPQLTNQRPAVVEKDEFERLLEKPLVRDPGIFEDPHRFEHAQRVATLLVSSNMVPEHFRGKENLGNAVIAVDMAFRLKLNPLLVMQHLYVVHGKPGLSAQFVIAVINASQKFSRLEFDLTGKGDSLACVARAKDLKTGQVLKSTPITMELAKKEGWLGKNGSKWQSMPDQMMVYRSASFWGRAYAPEFLMGLQTVEELQDVTPTEHEKAPKATFDARQDSALFAASADAVPMTFPPKQPENAPPAAAQPAKDAPSAETPPAAAPAPEKPPQDKPAPNYPKAIKGLLRLANISEVELIAYLHQTGQLDESVGTLSAMGEVASVTVAKVHDQWKTYETEIKRAKEVTK